MLSGLRVESQTLLIGHLKLKVLSSMGFYEVWLAQCFGNNFLSEMKLRLEYDFFFKIGIAG